jgi:hypothetical protein
MQELNGPDQIAPNDTITSKPIYIFDEDMIEFKKSLDDARAKNKRIVIFEDGSKFYDFCFKKDVDILLNPYKNGYSWDMLNEFNGDYISFIKIIIQAANINEEKTKIYLNHMLLNIEKMTPVITTSIALQKLIFQPLKEIIHDISEILLTQNDVENYKIIRSKLALNLDFLKSALNANEEISIRDYVNNCYGQILFISCLNDKNAMKLSELIFNSTSFPNVLKIFSPKITIQK